MKKLLQLRLYLKIFGTSSFELTNFYSFQQKLMTALHDDDVTVT